MSLTPFYDIIAGIAQNNTRFFVPGHKGKASALPGFASYIQWDITEVFGADDLTNPKEELLQSQKNMARAFGSGASLYTAFGTSSAIMAMLALFVGRGGKVVMARGAHVAAIKALALLGIKAKWVMPCQKSGVPTAQAIGDAINESGAKAVYITTVDYYGRMPDVRAIAAVCEKHRAVLLCDNAHGAYLKFMPEDIHPISLGAAAVADSAHKTLPCITPAAILHLKDGMHEEKARAALNLFSGTSPSYPVLLSLDLCAGLLLSTPPDFTAAARQVEDLCGEFSELVIPCQDSLRIILNPLGAGYTASEFHSCLITNSILPEYFDGKFIVYMASPSNTAKDYSALRAAIHAACAGAQRLPKQELALPVPDSLPKAVHTVREAYFAESEGIPVETALGRIMCGICAPCPPGVPCVLPGEVIDENSIKALQSGGVFLVDVLK